MGKTLFISGSPRNGNTEFILKSVFENVSGDKELILLRKKKISGCSGCLYCENHEGCCIDDDMLEIYPKMKESDILVFGTPNYFDNVSGLLKNFIDRTNPLYHCGANGLKGKRLVSVVVGGGKVENSMRVVDGPLRHFSDTQKMDMVGSFCFKFLGVGDAKKDAKISDEIKKIASKINSLGKE